MIKLKKLIPEHFIGIATQKPIARPFKKSVKEQQIEAEKKEIIDLSNLIADPTNNITTEMKKVFLESVSKYNEYGKSIYRQQSLKEISRNIVALGKLAEKIAISEADDWFDAMTIKRDMKSLSESVKMFEAAAREMSQLQHRLESLYEEIGTKLSKYFQID